MYISKSLASYFDGKWAGGKEYFARSKDNTGAVTVEEKIANRYI